MKKCILNAVLFSFYMLSYTQENSNQKKVTISGSLDAYFRSNLNAPNDVNQIAPSTSFADEAGFALGMVNLIGSYQSADGKVGAKADLVFGPRGEAAVFNSEGSSNIVNQLYVYWSINDKVTLTFGNFNTFLGYELISPVSNFNYSTSYMFSYGPFSHTGLKADFTLSENLFLLLAVMNSTDFTEFNLDGSYTFGAQFGFYDQYINFLYGNQTGSNDATFQIDFTGGFNITDPLFLGINATYNDTDGSGFYGLALYPQYNFSKSFSLGLRGEYFAETELGVNAIGAYDSNGDANVFAATLTGSYNMGDLIIKPELRIDTASEDVFLDTDLINSNNLASFVLGAIYSF